MGDVIAFGWLSRNWTTRLELDPQPWRIGEKRNYGEPGTIWAREADQNHLLLKPFFNMADANGPILAVYEVDDIERHDDFLIHARRRRLLNAVDFSRELVELAATWWERELVLRLRQDHRARDAVMVERRASALQQMRADGADAPWSAARRAQMGLHQRLSSAGLEARDEEDNRCCQQFNSLILDRLFPSWSSNLLAREVPVHPETSTPVLVRERKVALNARELEERLRHREAQDATADALAGEQRRERLQDAVTTLLPGDHDDVLDEKTEATELRRSALREMGIVDRTSS